MEYLWGTDPDDVISVPASDPDTDKDGLPDDWEQTYFGDAGLYGVAAISGLTDVDAITLSVANLADAGRVETGAAWRAILLATPRVMVTVASGPPGSS